ncbi:MAG TPA: polysaccharide deacetylase family protein [Deltaproteobacteria bacterium]|nr:polysaccharide deacetylase family protein [Deltaproteobacteria bacterium]
MPKGFATIRGSQSRQHNAITIDVEDWYHICGLDREPVIHPTMFRVHRNIRRILDLLSGFNIRATFFMLGCIAESDPELAKIITDGGHEIASHGYSHRLVFELSPAEFRSEIRRTSELLESQTGQRPIGFRAPRWSLNMNTTPWAFHILAEEGYLYDSSLNPLPGVGNTKGSRAPFRLHTECGDLMELPPLVAHTPLTNLPVGGGWGLRLFPASMICNAVDKYNALSWPAVLFVHPREVDPEGPRLDLSPLKGFAAYGTRKDVTPRLKRLFARFSFTTMKELAATCQSAY